MSEVILILHNLRSAHNVGAIFRTAEAAGVNKIYLTGYTPAPVDKFKRPNKEIAKTALGAEKTVAWEKVEDISDLIQKLKEENFQIIAVEQDKRSVDYKKVSAQGGPASGWKVALIFGNEVDGLERTVLDQCDLSAEIPMLGKKESLNVSVAVGVALFRMLGL